MPRPTLDTITDRTRALVSRTGDQVSRTMSDLLPAQYGRRTPANRLQKWLQGLQDLMQGTPRGRRVTPTQKVRQRARTMARRAGNRLNVPDLGNLLQRGALIFVGTRLATDWTRRMRRVAPGSQQRRAINVNVPSLPWRGRLVARGATTSTMAATGVARTGARTAAKAATGTVRASYRIGVGVGTTRTTMKTTKTAGRGWWRFRRAQAQLLVRATQRRMRRGWRRARAFTIGFATGAIWAYLFAPRQGPAYQKMQEGAQRTA